MDHRPMLVGYAPKTSIDHPFLGTPSWNRLCSYLRLSSDELEQKLELANLSDVPLDSPLWSTARIEVGRILSLAIRKDCRTLLLCGPKVANAFGFSWNESHEYFQERRVEGLQSFVVPDACNRKWWADPYNQRDAQKFWMGVLELPPHGQG